MARKSPTQRPGKPDGFTCCELADLSNAVSQHDERIDVVFAFPAPASVKANVLDTEAGDKTLSGHWPSDHASVSAELTYEWTPHWQTWSSRQQGCWLGSCRDSRECWFPGF